MFIKILKREIVLSYLVYVLVVVLVALMTGAGAGWQPEKPGLMYALRSWHHVAPVVPGLTVILYVTHGWMLLSALSRLADRPILRRDVLFYFLTTVLYLVLTGLAVLIPYLALKPLLVHLRDTSITEVPVLLGYLLLLIVAGLLAKAVTYLKLRTRILYFCLAAPSLAIRHWFGGFRGRARMRGFFWFLLIVTAYTAPTLLLFVLGIWGHSAPLLLITLTVGLLSFSIGRFHLLFAIWNRVVP